MSNLHRFSPQRPSLPLGRRPDREAIHPPADAIMPARPSMLDRCAPDSTGTLDLSQVPPTALWLLGATVRANQAAWNESVRTIIFPAGMAIVPDGVTCLTSLARVELPNFKGLRVDLRMSRPQQLHIAIGVDSSTPCVSFLIPSGCDIDWMDERVAQAWSTVEFDENGIPGQATHHRFMRKELEEGVDAATSLLENVINEDAFARMRKQFKFRYDSELALLEETLCLCGVQTGYSLAQHAAGYGGDKLERLVRFILARDATPIAKQRFLIAAMQPDSVMVPWEVARKLPVAIDRILEKFPGCQINRNIIRASVGLFPREPGGSPDFHELFLETDPVPFRNFVDSVVDASKCHEDMDILFYQDHAGRTIFHIAAETGDTGNIDYLIKKISLKSWATSGGGVSNILYLGEALKKKTRNGDTALWHAAARGEDAHAWIQSLMNAIDAMAGSGGTIARELKQAGSRKLVRRLDKNQQRRVRNIAGGKELEKVLSTLGSCELRRAEDSVHQVLLLIGMLRIDRPRAADATVLKKAMESVILTNDANEEHQDALRVVTDVLTFCGDGTTALHGYAKGNGSGREFGGFLSAMLSLAASETLSQIEITRYLLSKDADGATALHQFARTGRMTAYVATLLQFPSDFPLAPLWSARNASDCTPFWGVVSSRGSSFSELIYLIGGDTRIFNLNEQLKARLAHHIKESISKASEKEIVSLLESIVLVCKPYSGLEAPVAFLFESIVSAELNGDRKVPLLSQALGRLSIEVLRSLEMRSILAPLLQAKPANLTSKHKSLLLLTMVQALLTRNTQRSDYVPVILAIRDASCSSSWKMLEQLKIDVICSAAYPGWPTRLHLVEDAEQIRKTMEGWISLARREELQPELLTNYLFSRTQNGTALHAAVKRARPELVGALLDPLLACGNNHTVAFFAEPDCDGRSAFEVALQGRHAGVVAQFLGLVARYPRFLALIEHPLAQEDAQEIFTDLLAVDTNLRTVLDVLIQAGDVVGLKLLLDLLGKAPLAARQSVFKGLLAMLEHSHILWGLARDTSSQTALGALMDWLCKDKPALAPEARMQLWAAFGSHRPLQRRLDRVCELLSPQARDQLPGAWSPVRTSQVSTTEVTVEESPASLLKLRRIDMEHSLNGKVTRQGEAVGGHALLNRHALQIEAGSKVLHLNGTFTASVKIFNARTRAWVAKATPSTFFPETWKEAEIVEQIASALRNGDEFGSGVGPWDRLSDAGLWIRFYRHPGTAQVNCHPLPGFPPRES